MFSLAYYCGREAVTGMKDLESRSKKEDVTRNAFKKLEGLHLPSLLQKVCAHMNLKDSTLRSTQNYIDALITEQWVIFHLDHPDNKQYVNQTAGMRQCRSFSARGLAHSTIFFTSVQLPMRRSDRSRSTKHDATENWAGKFGLLGGGKKYEVSVAVAKVEDIDRCTSVADWLQGRTSITADAGRAETTAKED